MIVVITCERKQSLALSGRIVHRPSSLPTGASSEAAYKDERWDSLLPLRCRGGSEASCGVCLHGYTPTKDVQLSGKTGDWEYQATMKGCPT